jgi:hypothetical protein
MKTRFFAIAMFAVMTLTAGAQTNDEFSNSLQTAKTNYGYIKKQKQPHQDVVQAYIGNDVEPTILYSEDNHGWSLDAFGQFGTFASNPTFGGGVGLSYHGRHWGSGIKVGFRRAKEDDASDRKAKFNQGQVDLLLYYNLVEWNNHHDIISAVGGVSFQLSSFLDEDSKTWTTMDTDIDGTTTTTTTTAQNLDIRQFTIGAKGGLEYEHKFKFSPFSIIAGGTLGAQQNIVMSTNKWYLQTEVYVGVRVRFNQHKSYNDKALNELGMTRADVWR